MSIQLSVASTWGINVFNIQKKKCIYSLVRSPSLHLKNILNFSIALCFLFQHEIQLFDYKSIAFFSFLKQWPLFAVLRADCPSNTQCIYVLQSFPRLKLQLRSYHTKYHSLTYILQNLMNIQPTGHNLLQFKNYKTVQSRNHLSYV